MCVRVRVCVCVCVCGNGVRAHMLVRTQLHYGPVPDMVVGTVCAHVFKRHTALIIRFISQHVSPEVFPQTDGTHYFSNRCVPNETFSSIKSFNSYISGRTTLDNINLTKVLKLEIPKMELLQKRMLKKFRGAPLQCWWMQFTAPTSIRTTSIRTEVKNKYWFSTNY